MKKIIKKAFTLVELLVVIAILAILATVSVVGYSSFTKKAKESNINTTLAQVNNYLIVNVITNENVTKDYDFIISTLESCDLYDEMFCLETLDNEHCFVYDADANSLSYLSCDDVSLPSNIDLENSSLVNINANNHKGYYITSTLDKKKPTDIYTTIQNSSYDGLLIYENEKYYKYVDGNKTEITKLEADNDEDLTKLKILSDPVENAYEDFDYLKSVVVESNVTKLSKSCFRNSNNIETITFNTNVITNIGIEAFNGCSSLTSIIIPNSVTSIGNTCFKNCTSLTSITLSSSLTNTSDYLFNGCSKLSSITLPENITKIEDYAFQNSGLTNIIIPSKVTTINGSAFDNCSKLTSVTLPVSVKTINSSAFSNCHPDLIITYLGTASDFEKITNKYYLNGLKVKISDTTYTVSNGTLTLV